MRKGKLNLFPLLLACVMLLSFSGCSSKKTKIEDHNWNFSMVQNREDGQVIYCATDNKELYDGAEVLDIWCSIDDGIILISNNDTQETWSLTYSLTNKEQNTYIYDVLYSGDEEITGIATVGITTKQNENDEYTLIVTIDEYVLYFTEKIP